MARPSHLGLIFALFLFALPSSPLAFHGPGAHGSSQAREKDSDPELKISEELAVQMLRVPSPRRRTEILEELIVRAKEHRPSVEVLRKAVQDAWLLGCKRLGTGSVLRPFKPLVAKRKELDRLRAETLALVRDEFEYPYPYKAPLATREEVGRYRRSQKQIDLRVDAMREMWRNSPRVKISAPAASALELAHWARLARGRVGRESAINFPLPRPDLPAWALGIPLSGDVEDDVVTLENFGTSLYEGKRFAQNRAVRQQNEELRADALEGLKARAERERVRTEFEQVARTNDYRELLGLHTLRLSPELLEACEQHAEYVWELGEVTHEQPSAEFFTHNDRARRAGYPTRVWENCHLGSNLPFDVLEAWRHSSEHHRVMVLEVVAEIATGRAGLAWVQNYGLDTGFRSAIQWGVWRD